MCSNFRSIEWHQKTYHKISWDYPFKIVINKLPIFVSGTKMHSVANICERFENRMLTILHVGLCKYLLVFRGIDHWPVWTQKASAHPQTLDIIL
jgi:hypothetical protein